MKNFHIKIGDYIKVITGNNKGKIGKIIGILKKKNSVFVEGINKKIRNVPKKKEKDLTIFEKISNKKITGKKKEIIVPINISNVMFWNEENKIVSRIGYKFLEQKKFRYLKKTKELINN
jgi:large subunit ribosomal protein L24